MTDVLNIENDRRENQRRSSDDPSITKFIGIAVVVVGLVTTIFTAGYNWKSVTEIKEQQDQFVRKDVQQEQYRALNEKVEAVIHQLDNVQSELRSQRK